MTQISTGIRTNRNRFGSIIPIIIIVIVVVAAVFIINTLRQDPTGHVNQYPWTEENRIVTDSAAVEMPAENQFQLKSPKTISRSLSYQGEDRGNLKIEIDTSGLLEAQWKASYKEGEFEKDVSAAFEGNIDATMPYEDENGTDGDKLFFIAKGKFLLQAFKKNGNAQAGGGDAYIVGWLEPDGNASGTMVLAPDKKNTKIYTW